MRCLQWHRSREDCRLQLPVQTEPHEDESPELAVSLDKRLEIASVAEDIGPAVSPAVAELVTKIWDKDHKGDI